MAEKFKITEYRNKYVEIYDPSALSDFIRCTRCTVEPMKFYIIDEDLNIEEYEWQNN